MTDDEYYDYSLDRALSRNWDRILYDYGHEHDPFKEGDDVKVTAGRESFWCEIIGGPDEDGTYLAIIDNFLIADEFPGGKKHHCQLGDFIFVRPSQIWDVVRKSEDGIAFAE